MEGVIPILANLPPSSWKEALGRIEAVRAFRALKSPDGADVKRYADLLSLNPRSFYRLLRAYGDLRDGVTPKPSKRGAKRFLPTGTVEIMRQVRAELGREVPERVVHLEVSRRCLAAGLPAPSLNALRTRDKGSQVDLRIRLRRRFDLILDSCPLDVDVLDATSGNTMAWFTGLLDAEIGADLGHLVTAGPPTTADLLKLIGAGRSRSAGDIVLLATGGLVETLAPVATHPILEGVRVDEAASRALRAGAALVPAFGLKIGRISFQARRRAIPAAAVPVKIASQVVDHLLGPDRN